MDPQLLILKATVLFLGAIGVSRLFRRAPGQVHHAWTVTFAAILALPVFAIVLPPLDVPVPPRWSPTESPVFPIRARSTPTAVPVDRTEPAAAAPAASAPLPPGSLTHQPRRSFDWPTATTLIKGVWLAGTASALVMIGLSLWRVRRLSASAEEMRDPVWHRSAAAIGRRLGLRRRVRLVLSDQVDTPMAGGFRRPTVFLPTSAQGWDAERRRVVLAHELVHLARRDPLRHLAMRVTLALYWFNPVAWLAARSAALACEDACDASVVGLGIRPSSYARVLLELAEPAGRSRIALVALPIVRRSRLERRLLTILNTDHTRVSTRGLRLLGAMCAALTVALAAAHPRASVTPAAVATGDLGASRQVDPSGPPEAPPPGSIRGFRPASIGKTASPTVSSSTSVDGASAAAGSFSACAPDLFSKGSGEKASDTLRRGGMVVNERVERRGFTRGIQKSFGDLRVCLFAEAAGASTTPSDIVAQSARVILEVQQRGTIQQLELTAVSAGSPGMAWRQNSITGPVDGTVASWRQQMIDVLDTTWELTRLHGHAQTLAPEERDRQAQELESRRQEELSRLRSTIEAKARLATAASDVSPSFTPSTAPSACDLAASWASIENEPGTPRRRPRFLHETFGDLRVCLRVDEGNVFETVPPGELIPRAGHAVLEAHRNGKVQRLELTRESDGVVRAEWRVDGAHRPMDTAVETWRTRIVDVLDTSWQIFALRGREGALLGEMSLAQNTGKVQSLRAQIESLKVDERTAEWSSLREGQVERFRAAMAIIQ